MKIAVLGAGSLGILEGALITRGGYDCTLIATNHHKIAALNKYGARITGLYQATIPVKAVSPQKAQGPFDYILHLTKQTSMVAALEGIAHCIDKNTVVVSLQNGIPEDKIAAVVGQQRLIAGSVFHGAAYRGEGIVELTTEFDSLHIYIGELDGKITSRISKLEQILATAGGVTVSRDIMAEKYSKLVMNCAISGVSASLGCTFGRAGEDARACRLMTLLSCEGAAVLAAKGIKPVSMAGYCPSVDNFNAADEAALRKGDEQMRALVAISYNEVASMLQDIRAGLPECEIDYINGKLADEGKALGIATPINDKVVRVVTAIQNNELKPVWDNLSQF